MWSTGNIKLSGGRVLEANTGIRTMDETTSQEVADAMHFLNDKLPATLRAPTIGIICGSGLNGLADIVLHEPRFEISYADIPYFPKSTGHTSRGMVQRRMIKTDEATVHGHAGNLLFGLLEPGGRSIVLMVGRIQSVSKLLEFIRPLITNL